MSKNPKLREICTQVSQIEFQCDLTILRLILTVWVKRSQNSYLREFCAQMSQNVFLPDLTVLRLITTVWAKISENSYLHKFCAQVSQIVFLADLIVFTAYYNCMSENVTKHKTPRLLSRSVTNGLFRWFDLFTTFYNCISKSVTKLIFFRYLCTKVKNRVLSWIDSFTAYYNFISKNVKKLITPRDLYTSITNRVPMWSDHFTAYSNCMSEKVTKLVSPRVLCTHVAKRVLSLIWPFYGLLQLYEQKCRKTHISKTVNSAKNSIFDFCAQISKKYDLTRVLRAQVSKIVFLSKNVGKLISPRVLCTSVKNRVLRWFNRLTTYYNCISKNVKKTHISASSRHKYHKSCS